jgi:hypothetical protein
VLTKELQALGWMSTLLKKEKSNGSRRGSSANHGAAFFE